MSIKTSQRAIVKDCHTALKSILTNTSIGSNVNIVINQEIKMFNGFANWFSTYRTEATWFIIGWLCMAGLDQIGDEHYVMALIDFGLAYFNYKMWKENV